EIKNGKPVWIFIRSLLGRMCRIKKPWSKLYLCKDGAEPVCLEQKVVEFPTQKGDGFMIVPDEETIQNWETVSVAYQRNEGPKTASCGNATLGLPRMF
ncbi:MAG: hypothetical protein KAJ81_09625, partial [Candidatus Latescibacteria bacterium]|nr:hypothetical protein [Candidatus Latescibacterota bacterium]